MEEKLNMGTNSVEVSNYLSFIKWWVRNYLILIKNIFGYVEIVSQVFITA